ncbi:MAG: hypothetical protein ABGX83_00175 [Nitrospira sp.]|nr:hypothetical protein [Candidatus Manganitrophaceae bacterium]
MNITLTPIKKPVRLNTSQGLKVYKPGETFTAEFEDAQPFIKKGILRMVEKPSLRLAVGQLVKWNSPILGSMKGLVQMVPGDGTIVVAHPLTGDIASILVEWLNKSDIEKRENA